MSKTHLPGTWGSGRAASHKRPPIAQQGNPTENPCDVAVVWIDWYAYHLTRFLGLTRHPELQGRVAGIEIVGGIGVHAGLKFRESIPAGLPVTTLFPGSSWKEVKGLRGARAVWSCLTRLDPQVVLVPGYYTLPGLAVAMWGKVHGRQTVLMTESTESDHTRSAFREAFKSMLVRFLFGWAIAGGAPHRRYLQRLGFPAERIARFYDVVDNDFFKSQCGALRKNCVPSDFGLPQNYFLYVGRLAEEKNIAGLLASYLEYRRSGGSWALVLVGDGPLRSELENEAACSPFAADIRFEGLKGIADLVQYYSFASCFVLPSYREPWGLVVNEAMAAGLPVIVSSRCGCAEDLVAEGENGLLFDPSDPLDLTASLVAVGSLDRSRLHQMGTRSEQIVSQFCPNAWASEVARIARG